MGMFGRDRKAIRIRVFGKTDLGRTRDHNEDRFLVADLTRHDASLQPHVREHVVGERGSLLVVADGMGGAAAGEVASEMATDTIYSRLLEGWGKDSEASAPRFAYWLKDAVEVANTEIHAYAKAHPEVRGMGTTTTAVGVLADHVFLSQVGDSRAYLVRDGVAHQLTKDQSLMLRLVEAGEITEEEAAHSERRNIILQALGPEATVKVDLTHQKLRRGDTLVLCSDGLSGQVSRDEIAGVVREERDLAAVCRRLIDMANSAGGPDNITVIAARFDGAGLESAAAGDEVGHRVFPLPDSATTPTRGSEPVAEDEDGRRITTPVHAVRVEALPQPAIAAPVVSEERRARGLAIQRILLVTLVVAAGAAAVWWIARLMRRN